MKSTALLMAFSLAAVAAPVSADKGGSCHFHGSEAAKEDTILRCAVQRKDALASGGKIEGSWKGARQEKLEQVDGKKGKEWRVTFRNPEAKEKGKEALYVFLSLQGNVLAANFSGK